jgi:hypothetical protein
MGPLRWLAVHLLGWHASWWDETDTLPRMGRALRKGGGDER